MRYLQRPINRRSAPALVAGAAAIALTISLIACPEETSPSPPSPPPDTGKAVGETCVADNDCKGDLICTGTSGAQECSQAGTGMSGSVCGTDDHCTDTLICGGDGACGVMSGGTCAADDDCAGTLTCGAGICSTGMAGDACNADNQCTDPLVCTGTPGTQICSDAGNGMPGSVCGNNDHCDGALICGNGQCGVAAGSTCTADSDCADALICTGTSASLVCSQSGTGAAGSVCGIDDHCTDALICGDGACGAVVGAACSANNDCAGDLTCGVNVCSTGAAGNACNADNQCTNSLVCNGAAGSQVCGTAGTGGAGSVCGNNNHCTGAGLTCASGTCGMDTDRDGTLDSADIDDDNDGLIEISTLVELHNMRYNLAGTTYDDEEADTGTGDAGITTGAPTAPTPNCTTATDGVYLCGYELTQDLDFDLDQDGSTHTNGTLDVDDNAAPHFVVADGGWDPIGTNAGSTTPVKTINSFRAIFEGNGYTIANMTISRSSDAVGFFGTLRNPNAQIRNIGLTDVYVVNTSTTIGSAQTGGLVGLHAVRSVIIASYVTGNVIGASGTRANSGGLTGTSTGDAVVIASYANVNVSGGAGRGGRTGGLVGLSSQASVTASYATGNVNGGAGNSDVTGGLMGWNAAGNTPSRIIASYATGDANAGTDTNDAAGAIVGSNTGGSITASYGFGTATGAAGGGVSTKPTGVTSASGLTADNVGAQWSDASNNTLNAWIFGSDTRGACTEPVSPTSGVTYADFTTRAACEATASPAKAAGVWVPAAPKLRYADYDGDGTTYSCGMFPAGVTCGETGDEIPGQ